MNLYIKTIEAAQMNKEIPEFRVGDTLIVQLNVKEGTRERRQSFEGVVIARKNKGVNTSITLHRIVAGEEVEFVLPLYSPLVSNIAVKILGDVRKSKLYYIRGLNEKAARIKQRRVKKIKNTVSEVVSMEEMAQPTATPEVVQSTDAG